MIVDVIVRQLRDGDVVLGVALGMLLAWLLYQIAYLFGFRAPARVESVFRMTWQGAVVLGLEQAYELARGVIPQASGAAWINAYRILDFEWSHGFFVESRVEHFFLQFGALMNAIDAFYIVGHVGVTLGALLWLYLYRRDAYLFMRNLLMMTTAIALVVFYVFPTAPPRLLLQYGFVDPLELHHLVSAGGSQPGSYTYDPYAAMPSLHVVYALLAAWALFRAVRHPLLRILIAAYPLAMIATVIISANHWLLDVVGAFVTVAIARLALAGLTALRENAGPPIAAILPARLVRQ